MTDENKDNDLDSLLGQEEIEDWDQELGEGLEEEVDEAIPGLDEEGYPDYSNEPGSEEVEVPEPGSVKVDAQTESTDEDEIPAKGLLSTGSGKFVVVAGAVVVAVGLGGGYHMMTKGSSNSFPDMSNAVPSEAKKNSPVPAPVEEPIEQSSMSDDDFSLGQKSETASGSSPSLLAPQKAESQAGSTGESVSQVREQEAGTSVLGDSGQSSSPDLLQTENVSESGASNPVSLLSENKKSSSVDAFSQEKSEPSVSRIQGQPNEPVQRQNDGLSKEEVQQIVAQVISEELRKSAKTDSDEKVVRTLEEIQSKMNQLDSVIKKQSKEVDKQSEKVEKIAQKVVAKPVQEEKSKRYPAHVVEGLKEGRSRLPGFKVFNSTEDGTMSVVKTPSGNVNVYFKGERFYITGNKLVTVESIHDDGYLVLVSGGYYIDDTLVEPKRAARKPDPKPEKKKVAEKKVDNSHRETAKSVKPATEREIVPIEDTRRLINGREVLAGWSLNAIFGGDKSYLLTSPNGDWDTYASGDTIPDAGIISGLDDDRNLIVGNHVILLSK